MHRERDHRLHEIIGAAPYPDWLPLLSKVLACAGADAAKRCLGPHPIAAGRGRQFRRPLVYLQSVCLRSGFTSTAGGAGLPAAVVRPANELLHVAGDGRLCPVEPGASGFRNRCMASGSLSSSIPI
jgi:hypothetical protein